MNPTLARPLSDETALTDEAFIDAETAEFAAALEGATTETVSLYIYTQ